MSNRTIRILLINCLLTFIGFTVYGNQTNLIDSITMDTISCYSSRLKILSWNIGMLPVVDLFQETENRIQAIANVLYSSDYDIIVFQEAFTSQSRTIIKHTLHALYPFSYGPANGSKFSLKFNSGLWIISKIPLQVKKEIEFKASAGFDAFARKGAVLLEGQFNNSAFQIIATHLQDDDYPQHIRDQQLTEIFNQLIFPYSDMKTLQIICGDLNTDEKLVENYTGMLTILNAENGVISGKTKISFDDEANDTFKSDHPNPRLIDYILTRNSNVIQWISRRVAVLKYGWGNSAEYLSDHHGIEAVIVFRKGDFISKIYK